MDHATEFLGLCSINKANTDAESFGLPDLYIDWEAGEIRATATVRLKFKFVMKGKHIDITEIRYDH